MNWIICIRTKIVFEANGTNVNVMKSNKNVVIPVQTIIVNPSTEINKNGKSWRLNLFFELNFICVTSQISFIVFCKTPNAPNVPIKVKTIVIIDVTIELNGVATVSKICWNRLAIAGPTMVVIYCIRVWKELVSPKSCERISIMMRKMHRRGIIMKYASEAARSEAWFSNNLINGDVRISTISFFYVFINSFSIV